MDNNLSKEEFKNRSEEIKVSEIELDNNSEIIELESKVKKMVENIEALNQEAVSFSIAKNELIKASKEFSELIKNIKQVSKDSADMLKEVQSIGVQSTLNKLNEGVQIIRDENEQLIKSIKEENIKFKSFNLFAILGFSVLTIVIIVLSLINVI